MARLTTPGPLAGLRVLDLSDPSGAYAGRLLAALGADVVLVEGPEGHAHRGMGHATFAFYHAGKRSIVVDRETPAGRRALDRLAAHAEIVVTTDPSSEARIFAARHPHAIVASITPFGHDGPHAAWVATDAVSQAMGGLAFVNGAPGAPPLSALGRQAHHQAGLFAAIGALAVALGGQASARGRLVDVSIQAAVAATLEHVPGLFLGEGTVPRRQGTLHWTRAFRAGRCRDGWILHSTMGDWTSLAGWVANDLGARGARLLDPQWEDSGRRRADAEEVFAILDEWAAMKSVASITERAQLLRLPYATLASPAAVTGHPQLLARRLFDDVPSGDEAGSVPVPRPPFLLDGLRPSVGAAPELGEHDGAVQRAWSESKRAAPVPTRRSRDPRPLSGVRVLDFTWVVAGPVATRVLADLGARVVKVEHPDTDTSRDRRGGFTGMLNRGKESIVVDLRSEHGRRLARTLAEHVDVVADNFSARVMPQLGLDAATLRAEHPALVCLGMTGYGATGPWSDRVSYGPTLQAEAGFTLGMPGPNGEPCGLGYSYSDLASGHLAAVAVLASLWRRERNGGGATIDFSQFEALVSLMDPSTSGHAPDGAHGVHPAAGEDRWIAISLRSDDDTRRLAEVIGRPAVDDEIAAWTRSRDPRDAAATLQAHGVPAGPVSDARDLLVDDPQLAARAHVVTVATPEGGAVRLDSLPIRLDGVSLAPRRPGPLLGEHTRLALGEMSRLTAAELDALEADGTVVQWQAPSD